MSRSPLSPLASVVITAVVVATGCSSSSTTSESAAADPVTATTVTATTTLPEGSFTGVDGVTIDVADPSRIITLAGDITEIVYELGLGDNIVAVDITTLYPPAAEELKASGGIIGFGQALNAESVLKFDPTVVIGDETIEPPEAIEQLRDAGVPVAIIETQKDLDGVRDKILQIAHILGVDEDGAVLADRVMDEVDVARAKVPDIDPPLRVTYMYSRGPSLLYIFGEGIPTGAMIEGAGAIDAGAELGEGAMTLTPEALVASAPDVIVLPQSGVDALGGVDAILEIPGVAETPAGRTGRLLVYDEAYFFNLGPRVGHALDEFVTDLYAESPNG